MDAVVLSNSDIDRIKIFFFEGFKRKLEDMFKNLEEIESFKERFNIIDEIAVFSKNLEYCSQTYKFTEILPFAGYLTKIYIPLSLKNIYINNEIISITREIFGKLKKWTDNKGSLIFSKKNEEAEFAVRIKEIIEFAAAAKIKNERETGKEKIVPITSTDLQNLKQCIYDIYTNFSHLTNEINSNIPDRYVEKDWFKNYKNIEKSFITNLTLLQKEYFGFRRLDVNTMLEDLQFEIRNSAMDLKKNIRFTFNPAGFKLDVYQIEIVYEILREFLKNIVEHSIPVPEKKNTDEKKIMTESSVYEISLKFIEDEKNVYIEITDNGTGFDVDEIINVGRRKNIISDTDMQNIGELFFNLLLNIQIGSSKNGRGRGLKLIKNNVDKINGQIRFKLRNIRGSHIILEFPHYRKIV